MQKSYQEEISPDDLPFDLTAELGEVVAVELKSLVCITSRPKRGR